MKKLSLFAYFISVFLLTSTTSASTQDLAKATQNPVSDLISLPFQNNMNFGFGPNDKLQNVLNIQPVIPITLNNNWNLITRTILPVISQPALTAAGDRKNGLGDLTFTAFLSPKNSGSFIWGSGPVFLFPTATPDELGSKKWGIGPSFVGLIMQGDWVYGALISNIWSYAGDNSRPDVNVMTLQPFINYNLPKGWYLTTSPIVTANWEASSSNEWTVPIGGGVGKIFRIGKQPLNAQIQAYDNVVTPKFGAGWTLRLQLQFLFPKG